MNFPHQPPTICSMTPNNSQNLGPLERAVLKIVWNKNRASVQSVQSELLKLNKNKALAYTTVMTILTRLVDKQILSREKEGRCYYYFPKQGKPVFVRNLVRKTIDSMIARFGDEAIAAFLAEAQTLSSKDRQKLIDQINSNSVNE